ELGDAARAVRTVRARANEWKIDPRKIGIMGSSAGGHLASTLMTHFDSGLVRNNDPIERVSSRPDFGILCYAVITLGPKGHEGSRVFLLGKDAPQSLVDELSNEKHVTKSTPPAFLWSTADDPAVPVVSSLMFAQACRDAQVPVEMHIYEHGAH